MLICYSCASVAPAGLPDVIRTINAIICNSTTECSTEFIIRNDDILEGEELFVAVFDITQLIESGWNARKGRFPVAYIVIEDDDCEHVTLCLMYALYIYQYIYILSFKTHKK